MNDIGRMSWGILDNVSDLADIWLTAPGRRVEFGPREIEDLQRAHTKLGLLVSAVIANPIKEVA